MAWRVQVTPVQVAIKPEARRRCVEILARVNVEAMRSGRESDGSGAPPGVDFYETGRLQSDIDIEADGYTFAAPYAEAVDARTPFAGLPDDVVAGGELTAELGQVLDAEGGVTLAQEED